MSLIFKDEEQPIVPSTEQPKPEVKATGLPIQSAPVQGVTPPTVTGVPDEKFVEMLEKVITENNVPGLDYVELKQALDNMRALALDEPTKFVTVFSILSAQGCTKESLLSSIDKYSGLIIKEQEGFQAELTETFNEKVESKRKKIQESQEKVVELSNKIKELNDFIITATQEAQQEEMKLRLTEANFNQSIQKVLSVLNSDKEKITNYIK